MSAIIIEIFLSNVCKYNRTLLHLFGKLTKQFLQIALRIKGYKYIYLMQDTLNITVSKP